MSHTDTTRRLDWRQNYRRRRPPNCCLQLINLRKFRLASFSEVTAIHSEQYFKVLEKVRALPCAMQWAMSMPPLTRQLFDVLTTA